MLDEFNCDIFNAYFYQVNHLMMTTCTDGASVSQLPYKLNV